MHVSFDVYDALPDASNPQARNISVSLRLLDEKGAKAFEIGPLDATQLAATRPEAVPVNIEIPLKDIAPGRYNCQLNVVDEAGGKSASPQTRAEWWTLATTPDGRSSESFWKSATTYLHCTVRERSWSDFFTVAARKGIPSRDSYGAVMVRIFFAATEKEGG